MESITFFCSQCGQALRAKAESAGRKARCGKCGSITPIPQSPSTRTGSDTSAKRAQPRSTSTPATGRSSPSRAREEEQDERGYGLERNEREEEQTESRLISRRGSRTRSEESASPRPGRRTPGTAQRWNKVKIGILLVFLATCFLGVGFALQQVFLFVPKTISLETTETLLRINQIGAYVILGQSILALIGYGFCLFVPNKHGSRGLAIAALTAGASHVLIELWLMCFSKSLSQAASHEMFTLFFSGTGYWFLLMGIKLLFWGELILAALFLRSVALTLKEDGAARSCMSVVTVGSIHAGLQALLRTVIALVVMNAQTVFGPPSEAMIWLPRILYYGGGILFALQLVFYLLNLKQLREVLAAKDFPSQETDRPQREPIAKKRKKTQPARALWLGLGAGAAVILVAAGVYFLILPTFAKPLPSPLHAMKEATDVLSTVTDQGTADAAKNRLVPIGKRLGENKVTAEKRARHAVGAINSGQADKLEDHFYFFTSSALGTVHFVSEKPDQAEKEAFFPEFKRLDTEIQRVITVPGGLEVVKHFCDAWGISTAGLEQFAASNQPQPKKGTPPVNPNPFLAGKAPRETPDSKIPPVKPADKVTKESSPGSKPGREPSDSKPPPKPASKLTKENFARIEEGMSEEEVIEILGPPTFKGVQIKDTKVIRYVLPGMIGHITIKDGKVAAKKGG